MKNSLRILILSQYFWPEVFRINDVAKSLLDRGHVIEVLTGIPNYPSGKIFPGYCSSGCSQEFHQGLMIHRIPLIARGNGIFRLFFNYISFVFSGILFGPWILRDKKFDVIFVYAPSPILQAIPAIFIGWLKGIPVVLWVQDLWPESLSATGYIKNRWLLYLVKQVVKFIYRHVDLLLVQSKAFESPVRAIVSDVPIVYYPNSVIDAFSQQSHPNNRLYEIPALTQSFSILFAGNIGSAQAVHVIVEAAKILKEFSDINFVMLGDGSCRSWMLAEVEKNMLTNVFLPGRFPVDTMPAFMQKASALLVTLANTSIFAATVPNKVQAYLASGKPIIACLNGEGARIIKESEAGLVAPAEDARALAEAILHLYRMPIAEREKMGERGRFYFQKNFNHDNLVEKLVENLYTVIAKRSSR